ncbi:MAG: hypothetical protein OWT27_11080 [Firmicutes bacterium]|nr:hypothetical protein [Bacillota bacterium]
MMPRSYQKLWHQKIAFRSPQWWVQTTGMAHIYLEDVLVFAASLPFFAALVYTGPLIVLAVVFHIPKWATAIVLSLVSAYAARKFDPVGKPLPKFLWSFFSWFFSAHRVVDWRVMPRRKANGKRRRLLATTQIAGTQGNLPPGTTIHALQAGEVALHLEQVSDVRIQSQSVTIQKATGKRGMKRSVMYGVRQGEYVFARGEWRKQ